MFLPLDPNTLNIVFNSFNVLNEISLAASEQDSPVNSCGGQGEKKMYVQGQMWQYTVAHFLIAHSNSGTFHSFSIHVTPVDVSTHTYCIQYTEAFCIGM